MKAVGPRSIRAITKFDTGLNPVCWPWQDERRHLRKKRGTVDIAVGLDGEAGSILRPVAEDAAPLGQVRRFTIYIHRGGQF